MPWERVLEPGFWVVASSQLRAGDIIECCRDDLAWYGRVIVTSAYGQRITVAPLQFVELDAATPVDLTERSGFKIEDRGLTEKWAIVRLADNHTVKTGIRNRRARATRDTPRLGTACSEARL